MKQNGYVIVNEFLTNKGGVDNNEKRKMLEVRY
jgi:hypothetical protein